jgi:hypothetical protein
MPLESQGVLVGDWVCRLGASLSVRARGSPAQAKARPVDQRKAVAARVVEERKLVQRGECCTSFCVRGALPLVQGRVWV